MPTSIRELPAAMRVVCNCKGGRVFVHELPLRLAADVLGRLLVLINQRGQTPSWRGGERKEREKKKKKKSRVRMTLRRWTLLDAKIHDVRLIHGTTPDKDCNDDKCNELTSGRRFKRTAFRAPTSAITAGSHRSYSPTRLNDYWPTGTQPEERRPRRIRPLADPSQTQGGVSWRCVLDLSETSQ